MWRRRDDWKKRILSGLLAGLLVATSAMNAMGTIVAHAGQSGDRQKVSYKWEKEQKDIVISVMAENESFAPGEEVSLKVYVQNKTDAEVTGGVLSWKGSGLKEAGFPVTEEEESDLEEWEATVSDAMKATSSDAQSNGTRIWGIRIAAGEIYETEFHAVVDGDEDVLRMRTLSFHFTGNTELEGKHTVKKSADFVYNTGIAAMMPVEFAENEVEDDGKEELLPGTLITNTNEENIMYVRTRFYIDEIADYLSGPGMEANPEETDGVLTDPDKATDSDAAPAETKAPAAEPETTAVAGTEETTESETAAEETQTTAEETTEAQETGTVAKESESVSDTAAEETTKAETIAPDETLPEETSEAESEDQKGQGTETEAAGEEETRAEETAEETETKVPETEAAAEKEADHEESETKEAEIEKKDVILVQTSLTSADETPASEETQAEAADETAQEAEETEKEAGAEMEDTTAAETETVEETGAKAETEEESATAAETETVEETGAKAETEEESATETESESETERDAQAAASTAPSDVRNEEDTEKDKEFTNPRDIRYSITTYGAELKRVTARYLEEESGDGEMASEISFRVAEKTRPGLYFGTVNTSVRYDGKEYKFMQGFSFYVVGEGEIALSAEFNGSRIEVRGPEECFPEGDVLKLKVTEVPAEKEDMVMEAMERKADETGLSINKMKALDIKVISDGQEKELLGNVKVTFTDLKLEKVEGSSEKRAEELPEETAALFSRVIKTAESSIEEQTSSSGAEFVEVMHLDEESMELQSMSVEVSDDGTIVMDTTHFSIYIVVNFNAKEVELIVEHYAKFEEWNMVNGIPKEQESGNGNYVYPGADRVSGSGAPTFKTKEKKIYADDVHKLPGWITNGEPYKVSVDKLLKMGNYSAKEIELISAPTYNPNNYPLTNTANRKNISSNLDLELKSGQKNIVRIFYESADLKDVWLNAEFYDYNATVRSGKNSVKAKGVGINNLELTNNSDDDRIHIGLADDTGGKRTSDLDFVQKSDVHTKSGISASTLKKKGTGNVEYYEFSLRKGAKDPGLFSRGDIIVEEKYKDSGSPESVNYYAMKHLPGYELGFEKRGDTYTLKKVKDSNGTTVSDNLNRLRYTCNSLHSLSGRKLYSNLFWPLDKGVGGSYGKEKQRDPLFPNFGFGQANDEDTYAHNDTKTAFAGTKELEEYKNIKHNWYFGMRYDVRFSFGDYIGPANYYFRGDDDLWVYINGIKVDGLDLGGFHSAEPAFVDLKTWMINKGLATLDSKTGKVMPTAKAGNKDSYTMTVFFIERGGTGSCCFMSYTLPNTSTIELPHSGKEFTTYTATKKWYGDTAGTRPNSIQLQLFRNGKPYGDPVTVTKDSAGAQAEGNTWKYTWLSLPKKDEKGRDYTYSAKEVNTPLGYEDSQKDDGTLINTKLDSVTVEKVWTAGAPTEPVKVALYQKVGNSQETFVTDSTRVLQGVNGYWGYTWTNLPTHNKDQQRITYIPYEVTEVNGQVVKKKAGDPVGGADGEKYIVSYGAGNSVITNAYNYSQITVEKEWKDSDDIFKTRPEAITVQLYRRAGSSGDFTPYRDPVKIKPDEKGRWSHTWTEIPVRKSAGVEYEYQIRELSGDAAVTTGEAIILNGYQYIVTYPAESGKPGTTLRILNALVEARLILRKEIVNTTAANEPIDRDYKFMISLQKENGGDFHTSVALGHEEESNVLYIVPKADGENFLVGETVPMEYELVNMKMQHVTGKVNGKWWDKNMEGELLKEGKVLVNPGDTVVVTVYNTPDHRDYFHHTASVTNVKTNPSASGYSQDSKFYEQHGKIPDGKGGNAADSKWPGTGTIRVSMDAIVEDKETKQRERLLEEGDVLYG